MKSAHLLAAGLFGTAGRCVAACIGVAAIAPIGTASGAELLKFDLSDDARRIVASQSVAEKQPSGGIDETEPKYAASEFFDITTPPKRYLDAGTWQVTLGAGVASNFSRATDVNAFAQVSWFVAPKFELGVELGGWYFDQPGSNPGGGSVSLAMKYHFHATEDRTFTIFGEAGIGVLLASSQVPTGGTNVNFMPRIGFGATYALCEDWRLVGGVRWHHISNARIRGDTRNPSRDGVMAYLGVSIPLP